MISFLLKFFLKFRYRIKVKGLDEIYKKGSQKILFLPNHPGLIDPVIVMSLIYGKFKPRPLSDASQASKPGIRHGVKLFNPIILEDIKASRMVNKNAVLGALDAVTSRLAQNENVLFYPGGRLKRSAVEYLGANSGTHYILNAVKDARVVMVRTYGLWGSCFGWADGKAPLVSDHFKRLILALLGAGLFFLKKREVTVEFLEPEDFPIDQGKMAINGYLEQFYNEQEDPYIHIPYFFWEKKKQDDRAAKNALHLKKDLEEVPEQTKRIIRNHLKELTGVETIKGEDQLSQDLGLDSLKLAELVVFIENEFGFYSDDLESFLTVNDLYLAATGKLAGKLKKEIDAIPSAWFVNDKDKLLTLPEGKTIPEVFLNQVLRNPKKVIIADELSGLKTYRDMLLGIFVLKTAIEKLPGEKVGVMLPASVAASTLYMATLFAGKTPVMINWTTGEKNVRHGIDLTSIRHIITSRKLVLKLSGQGVNVDNYGAQMVYLEDVKKEMSLFQKIGCLIKSRFFVSSLRKSPIQDVAVVLFTSGSETVPKGVPLTHENFLTNLKDFSKVLPFLGSDKILGILPPFHSFGMTGNILMPLCYGMKTFYHANPTESAILSDIIYHYKPTMLASTPTFLNGILNVSSLKKMASLRVVISGAEKCPSHVFEALEKLNPETLILEAYGITECSPAVAANSPGGVRKGSIGRIFPSLEYIIVDENHKRVENGTKGLFLVRGKSIFKGYLGDNVPSPFVSAEGKEWYNTGDLIVEDESKMLTFKGRLKRFIKIGGEMISLPAIEEALLGHVKTDEEKDGPLLAVEAFSINNTQEVVLFTTSEIKREHANKYLRDEGFSPLYNIRRVVDVDEIPVLGTGKTDYRALKASFEN